MREWIHTCSSLEGPIHNIRMLLYLFGFILSSFIFIFLNCSNLWIKYDRDQYYEDNKPIFTFPHQSEIQYLIFISFNAYWCSKSTFSSSWRGLFNLGWHIVRLVRYLGSYGISPFSLTIEISSVSPQKDRLNHQNLEREVQFDPFFWGGIFKLILLILLIKKNYGWLGWTNKMKYPGSVYKNRIGNISIITITILFGS